jgi:hypothetical protein
VDDELAADGSSYCPVFALLDDATDETLAAALGRPVTDGCPEPLPVETAPQWWTVTAMAGVGTDDDGRPARGDDCQVVRLGRGQGVVLVTDQSAVCALTSGEFLDDATALVLSFDLDDVVEVEPDRRRAILRTHVRSMTVELSGASWGAVGFAVAGELLREPGTRDAPPEKTDADVLVARLSRSPAP